MSINFVRTYRYPQFFQKANEKILFNYYDTSDQIVFVCFFEALKTPKRHFEIKWPLARDWKHIFLVSWRSDKTEIRLALCRLSQKTRKRICFCFFQKQKAFLGEFTVHFAIYFWFYLTFSGKQHCWSWLFRTSQL